MQLSKDIFFEIVRLGIGHYGTIPSGYIDWKEIYALATQHGLLAVVIDGIEQLPTEMRPPQELLLEWIGEVLQCYEYRYDAYKLTIADMAGFYNSHGLKMMILKGHACSIEWPKPNHRPCGDIDIWLFGHQKEADTILTKEKSIKIDNTHHHHTCFVWNDFSVENHYDFLNVHHHKSNVELEKVFKNLGQDDSHFTEVNGEKVYLPSPNLHALFLLKHSMTDFAAFYVTFRQLIDWAFYVEKHGEEIDWKWLMRVVEKYHMKEFLNIINAICVEDFGFSSNIFPCVQFNPIVKEQVLSDILFPKFTRESSGSLIPRIKYKYKRWKGNAWKHELCYNENMTSAFWSGVWNHLLKPKSI